MKFHEIPWIPHRLRHDFALESARTIVILGLGAEGFDVMPREISLRSRLTASGITRRAPRDSFHEMSRGLTRYFDLDEEKDEVEDILSKVSSRFAEGS